MKCWRSVFTLLLLVSASEARLTPRLASNEITSEKPAVREDGWRKDGVVPFYKGLAAGLVVGTSLAMAVCVGFSFWLWKRGWRFAVSGGTSGHGKKTQRRHSGQHADYLELMPRAPLPPEPSDKDRLAFREAALNDDYLEPAARAHVPPESSENRNLAARVSQSSGAEYSEPGLPPEYLEPASGPYASLQMAEVGVPSVYSSVRYHGNQTRRHREE